MNDKVFSYLGLAQRSGNLVSGEDTCERLMKKNGAKLLIISKDASNNTQKKFVDMATYRNIKYFIFGHREELSAAIGKSNRAVYCIKDEGFAEKIYRLLEEAEGCSNKSGGEE